MKESPIRYFYDTEFVENGRTIDLVSFGMVAAPDWALDALVGTDLTPLIPASDMRGRALATPNTGVRTYYAVNADVDLDALKGNDWLVRNVLPHLPLNRRDLVEKYITVPTDEYPFLDLEFVTLDRTATLVKPKQVIANEVRDFILAPLEGNENDPRIELWADYAAYDHVALAQLWGPMVNLPGGIPMYTNDLQQLAARLGSGWKPNQAPEDTHSALANAWYALEYFVGLDALAAAE